MVANLGKKVTLQDKVYINKKKVENKQKDIVLAFYKPIGVTCTEKDKHAEKIINDYIHYPIRVTYAGRLDKESEGLLLLTNDGNLIDQIMRGANQHEKEYIVKVNKEITDDFIFKMSQKIYLEELKSWTRESQVQKIGKYTFKIILTQGLNRQIRRMCKVQGYQVTSLKRIRIMNIKLDSLIPGKYREITGNELKELYDLAGKSKGLKKHDGH